MVLQYLVGWTGGRIGSGVTVWHLNESGSSIDWAAINTAFGAWYTSIGSKVPNDVTWTFPFESKSLDDATGELNTVYTVPQRASISGTDSSPGWVAPAGRVVKWTTGGVVGGRRLAGHTYIVPSGNAAFNEGSITGGTLTADAAAHTALISALSAAGHPLRVWSRTHGVAFDVTAGATLARPSTLRSRND